MKKKVSEEELGKMMRLYGARVLKFRDAMWCPNCHTIIWKFDKMVDFQITIQGKTYLVEVKQGNQAWNYADEDQGIRPYQRETLDEWEETQGTPCWLFVVLGEGRAPKGRSAWLVPWTKYKEIEEELLKSGQKSLPRFTKRILGATDAFKSFELNWVANFGWSIPENHIFVELTGVNSEPRPITT